MADPAPDRLAEVEAHFASVTAEHVMEILHDEGLYRHVRFARPRTAMYHYDLVTWPGHLAISGDCGNFVFSRLRDMFEFFSEGCINPYYWSEKLVSPYGRNGVLSFSEEAFATSVREWAEQQEDGEARSAALRMIDQEPATADEAGSLLRAFDVKGVRIQDYWEWEMRDYTHEFLRACVAVRTGVAAYRARATPPAATTPSA